MFQMPTRRNAAGLAGRWLGRIAASAYGVTATLWLLAAGTATVHAAAPTPVISQNPLSVGGDVPGNVALALSVEFPTAISVAHQGNFETGRAYIGYFDHRKCYRYVQGNAAADAANTGDNVSHFAPVANAGTDFRCVTPTDTWSGNFLNWMTMQAIDPFRLALTGGYRRVDNTTTTILERAWSSTGNDSTSMGSDDNFRPIPYNDANVLRRRHTPTAAQIEANTPLPASFTSLKVSVRTRGNQVLFSFGGSGSPTLDNTNPSNAAPPTDAVGGTHYAQSLTMDTTLRYRFYVRVKVCDASFLEPNCKQYPNGNWKPEGLLHDYANQLRFSAFGYLNDPTDNARDGGVLRARQKFVGPQSPVPGSTPVTNTQREWDANTGVFVTNPDSADATATQTMYPGVTVSNSGVINYINKFGQNTRTYKRRDPVSELYYAALRYLKNQGNVPAWMPAVGDANRVRLIDGFPVINNWVPTAAQDPIQYACQRNYIVGIGDTNSSWDKNLPGSTSDQAQSDSGFTQPAKPPQVSADTTVSAVTMRNRVRTLNGAFDASANGTNNSDLMAGLAYHAATQDIRPDIANLPDQPRGQNVRTYWLDVLEFANYTANNVYYLSTKYGGLNIPNTVDFDPTTATAADIETSWWRTNTDTVGGQPRPDNYYTVADPQGMIDGLRKTFVSIALDRVGSASSLASNSTRLDADTVTFQAQFRSGVWGGELNAYSVGTNGQLSALPIWNATDDMLTGITGTPGPWAGRNIKTNGSGSLVDFAWPTLSTAQRTALVSADLVNYLRGERTNERSDGTGFRPRVSILGDIVNSSPLFVGAPNLTLHAGKAYAGGSSYGAWASSVSRTATVYVGANDGMLHAFNAQTGRELFAFVPNAVINNGLAQLANPLYEHRYYVDGEFTAAEIYDTASSSWKTVLVGSLGRGGPGVFALDITNPASPTLMWEKSTDIGVLGRNVGRPVIAQVANGEWRVFLGNGYDSGDGAYLVSIGLGGTGNGNVTTYAAETTTTNGMSAVLVRDSNSDGYADTAYAGDLNGSLWKISNLSGTGTVLELFAARDPSNVAQPITAAPTVAKDPATGYSWVFFGTGKYFNEADITDTQIQTWYGLRDEGTAISGRAELEDRDILIETTVGGVPARVIEQSTGGDLAGKRGWFIDLVSPTVNPADGIKGERMVLTNQFRGMALVGTTQIPEYTDPCSPGGTSFIMAINPFTGGRLDSTFFDMNSDGISNNADKYLVSGSLADGSSGYVIVSAYGFSSMINNPLFFNGYLQAGRRTGGVDVVRIFDPAIEASRMSWRELFNPN